MGRRYYINPSTGQKVYLEEMVPGMTQYRKASDQDEIDNEIKESLDYVIRYKDEDEDPEYDEYVLAREHDDDVEALEGKITKESNDRAAADTAIRQDLANYQSKLTDAEKLEISKKWIDSSITETEQKNARQSIRASDSDWHLIAEETLTANGIIDCNFGGNYGEIVIKFKKIGIIDGTHALKLNGDGEYSIGLATAPVSLSASPYTIHITSGAFGAICYSANVPSMYSCTYAYMGFSPDFTGYLTKIVSYRTYLAGTSYKIYGRL